MSIRTNPMKAVPLVLKHLIKAEKRADVNDLKSELVKIQDLFSIVKKNEDELLDTLTVLYNYLRSSNIDKLMEEKDDICNRIRVSTQKLLPADAIQNSHTQSYEDLKLHMRQQVNTAQSSSPQPEDLEMLKVNYNNLGTFDKNLFLSLLHFPENAVTKKRSIFLWWRTAWKSAMREDWEPGPIEFNRFFRDKLIVAHGNSKCPDAKKFKINPAFRHKLLMSLVQNNARQFCGVYSQIITSPGRNDTKYRCLAFDQRKVKPSNGFDFKSNHWTTVVNVSASYLDFGPQWLAKMKNLEVLQLGRWLHDSPKHHIEVQSQEFLNELRQLKDLWYLSLCGISGISELPLSIVQLESLRVLDLKACHNLETLPDDISSLRDLTYLDLSHCYLLDRMPKGIDKLTNLQVLKGFVIGSSINTPCRVSGLANLKRLEQLSIHIRSGAVIQDREFESLQELSHLERLKISWGVSDTRYSDIQVILPSMLKKLHLEGFPGQEIPDWLKPSKLGWHLEELNITGGKLENMNHGEHHDHWSVKILRLRYLKHLKVELANLQELFPELTYVEIRQIINHSYLEWSIDDES